MLFEGAEDELPLALAQIDCKRCIRCRVIRPILQPVALEQVPGLDEGTEREDAGALDRMLIRSNSCNDAVA